MANNFCDVIVIGAGISGLIAAKGLTEKGINVIVLEARDRIGGRTYTIKNSKVNYCDLGGSYVGNTQKNILKVIEELGLKTYKVNEKEDLLYYRNKKRIRFSSDQFLPSVGLIEYLDLKYMFRLIDKMGEEIPAEAPWNAPHAQQWDTITVKQFLDQNLWTDLARNFITKIFVQMSVTAEPYECSLLWFLWYVKQCGGSKIIHSTTNGAQERKIVGGSMQICEKIVEIIGSNKVVTNKPVVGITQTNNNNNSVISVSTLDGSEYNANYVILALPPPMQQRIHFNPPLSSLRSQLNQRCPMGSVIKCIIYYKTTFWRDKGFCGSILMDGFVKECPIQYTYDDTKPDGSFPAIVGFITTDYARQLLLISKKERLKLICGSIAKALNCEEANFPIHYEEYNWLADQYSGGGFTTICVPGFLTRYAKIIRQPIDRLYFAGTETATEWSGYMDGAIQAGKRAAKEVLQAIGKLPKPEICMESEA